MWYLQIQISGTTFDSVHIVLYKNAQLRLRWINWIFFLDCDLMWAMMPGPDGIDEGDIFNL